MTWLDKILSFLEKNLPWFLLGYQLGNKQDSELKKKNVKLNLKVKRAEHEKAIEDHNSSLSDDELRGEIIRRGRGEK